MKQLQSDRTTREHCVNMLGRERYEIFKYLFKSRGSGPPTPPLPTPMVYDPVTILLPENIKWALERSDHH